MKALLPLCMVGATVLCQCAHVETIPDTMIPHEFAGHSPEAVRNGYSMGELVCALPHVWEINPSDRGAFLGELYPGLSGGVPEDFVEVQTAHGDFVVIRLDKDLVAVATHAELVDRYDRVFVLRRVSGGWQDMTSRLFPFAFAKESRVTALRDKSIVVREPGRGTERRYMWSGSRFLQYP